MSLNDATCGKCGKRFGWAGRTVDRPPCPQCGDTIPRETLEEVVRRMNEMFAKVIERNKGKDNDIHK